MKVGILGAMPEEINYLESRLKKITTFETGQRTYMSSTVEGVDVVTVFSRWGKVSSASTVTTLLDRFKVDFILFIGLAGAVNPDLNVGDIVIATELMQHDMDASAVPIFQKFEIPLLNRKSFPVDSKHIALAKDCAEKFLGNEFKKIISPELIDEFHMKHPKVVQGLIASGDQFIADHEKIKHLRKELHGLQCIEMEGGAVAQVCFEHGVPFSVVRIISDKADHSAVIDFSKFAAKAASLMSGSIAHDIVQKMAKKS
ncbi:MAG: 5'-methylthioadenosine/adenosylhomocysteine nucleosidase [Verrucomicrobiota bacterium]